MTTDSNMIPGFLRPAPDSAAGYMRRSGANPWLQAGNLLWSAWLFSSPLFNPVTAGLWWSLGLGYPVFLLLFSMMYVRPYREVGLYVTALTVLACASLPWNPAAWTYGVFACAGVPYHGSLRVSILKIALIELALVLFAWWLQWPWYFAVVLVGVCTSTGLGSLIGRVNRIKDTTQRLSRDEVRHLAATAERERIGRDLHDLLGHTLSLITLKLELSRKLFDRDPAAAKQELQEAEKVARNALAEVRSAVTGIRASDLAAELASAHLLLESSGVSMLYERPRQPLPRSIEPALALAVREAATNIARHAQATRAVFEIKVVDHRLQVRIADDGRGGVREHGNGLRGMAERMRELGGQLEIDSARGRGTRLRIDIPMTTPSAVSAPQDTGEVPTSNTLAGHRA